MIRPKQYCSSMKSPVGCLKTLSRIHDHSFAFLVYGRTTSVPRKRNKTADPWPAGYPLTRVRVPKLREACVSGSQLIFRLVLWEARHHDSSSVFYLALAQLSPGLPSRRRLGSGEQSGSIELLGRILYKASVGDREAGNRHSSGPRARTGKR